MGAWIEINTLALSVLAIRVAPYMGAWIEISDTSFLKTTQSLSHPTWVRGLKLG